LNENKKHYFQKTSNILVYTFGGRECLTRPLNKTFEIHCDCVQTCLRLISRQSTRHETQETFWAQTHTQDKTDSEYP